MFNKNNNIKGINIIQGKLYQYNNILISSSLIDMMDNYYQSIKMQEKMDYQDLKTSYINRKYEYSIKKQYNPLIVNLCNNGLLSINNDEYYLKDFYIVFNDTKNDFHLKCKDNKFNKEEYDYNKAVKFIDTTAFIKLINDSNITNNKIIINDTSILNNIISNWDGYLHSETKETDAIINKKMIKDGSNE